MYSTAQMIDSKQPGSRTERPLAKMAEHCRATAIEMNADGHLSPGVIDLFDLNRLFRGLITLSIYSLYNPECNCTSVLIPYYPQEPSLGIALYVFSNITLSCGYKALHRNSQQGNCVGCVGQVSGAGVLYWGCLPPPPPMLPQSFFHLLAQEAQFLFCQFCSVPYRPIWKIIIQI